MRMVVVGLVVFALLAAGGVVYFVRQFLDIQTQKIEAEAESEVEQKESEPTILVLVSGSNLPAGTTLTSGSLKWQPWPEDGLGDEFTSSPEENEELLKPFIGSIIRRGIPAGIPITKVMVFKREAPGFLAGALEPGMRAVAVPVNEASGAAGFILPGDRVDVILTHDVRRDAPRSDGGSPVIGGHVVRFTSEVVVRDVRVVAIDQQVDDFEDKAAVVKTVSLEVTPKQAETLAVAASMGKLGLALRGIVAGETPEETDTFTTDLQASPTLSTTFGGGGDAAAKAAQERSSRPAARPTIKVYRGGDATVQEMTGQ